MLLLRWCALVLAQALLLLLVGVLRHLLLAWALTWGGGGAAECQPG